MPDPYRIVVAGLGPSTRDIGYDLPADVMVVGCNDVARFMVPDHLVLTDPPQCFQNHSRDKALEIIQATPAVIWSYRPEWAALLGGRDYREITCQPILQWSAVRAPPDGVVLPHRVTTMIPATALAWVLGAQHIGILGCDLLPDYNPGMDREAISQGFALLASKIAPTTISNLSPYSRLTGVPKDDLQSWLTGTEARC